MTFLKYYIYGKQKTKIGSSRVSHLFDTIVEIFWVIEFISKALNVVSQKSRIGCGSNHKKCAKFRGEHFYF